MTSATEQPGLLLQSAFEAAMRGEFDSAEQILLGQCQDRVLTAAGLTTIGKACHQARNGRAAEAVLKRAIGLAPENIDAGVALASLYLTSQEYSTALPHLERVYRLNPSWQAIAVALAQTHGMLGNDFEAANHYRAARTLGALSPELLWEFVKHLMALKRFEEMADRLFEVRGLLPNHVATLNDLGIVLAKLNRLDESIECFEQIVRLEPENIACRLNYCKVLKQADRCDEALAQLRSFRAHEPQKGPVYAAAADIHTHLGDYHAAVAECHLGLEIDPDSVDLHHSLGVALRASQRYEEAMRHFQLAQARDPNNCAVLLAMGGAAIEMGKLQVAEDAFSRLIDSAPSTGIHHHSFALVHAYEDDDPHITVMEERLRGHDSSEADQIALHFALGKAYDDVRNFEQAFHHFEKANALKRQSLAFDGDAFLASIEAMIRAFPAERFQSTAGGVRSARPIFVFGMPRSGSSLVEQVLSSHPDVAGLGERTDWQDGLHAESGHLTSVLAESDSLLLKKLAIRYLESTEGDSGGALRTVDKNLSNFFFAGLIHLALPNAKILHAKRDAVDTCISCFAQDFASPQPFAYDLGDLGLYYRGYSRLMEHWNTVLPPHSLMDVEYEAMVDNLEDEVGRILAFCGLPWHDACLNFHRSKAAVRTASFAQVRQPIYRSALRRREHYGPFVAPLLAALRG